LGFNLYAERYDNKLDRIPVDLNSDGFADLDAIGNVGNGTEYGLEIDATISDDILGWSGSEIQGFAIFAYSDLESELDGQSRQFNLFEEYEWSVSASKRLDDQWRAGVSLYENRFSHLYRLNVRDRFIFDGPLATVFLENNDLLGANVKVSVVNLLDAKNEFEREVWSPTQSAYERSIDNVKEFGAYLRIELSGNF